MHFVAALAGKAGRLLRSLSHLRWPAGCRATEGSEILRRVSTGGRTTSRKLLQQRNVTSCYFAIISGALCPERNDDDDREIQDPTHKYKI